MIPINTAVLTLPIAGQAPDALGAGVGATNSGLPLGQRNPNAAVLFSMLLTQLAHGENDDVSAPSALNAPNADVSPSTSNESSVEEQSVALSLLPLLVALNPEPPAVDSPAMAKATLTSTNVSETNAPVVSLDLGLMNVAAPPLPGQSPKPTSDADEDAPGIPLVVAKQSTNETVLPQAPAAVPDTVPESPITPRIFSTIATSDQQTTVKPLVDHASASALPPFDAQSNPGTAPDHAALSGRPSPWTAAEAQIFRKLDPQREPLTLHQDSVDKQAVVVDQASLGTGKIPVELITVPAPPSHPLEAPAPSPKVLPAMPNTVPVVVPPRETLHVQLEPSELGRVTLQVSVQSQQVQATVGVEHHGLGQFLTASQGALDDALRQHGLRIEEFHVETLANSDVAGLGTGRTGLDQGAPDHEAAQFQRQELRGNYPEVQVPDHGRTGRVEDVASPYRINIFA